MMQLSTVAAFENAIHYLNSLQSDSKTLTANQSSGRRSSGKKEIERGLELLKISVSGFC